MVDFQKYFNDEYQFSLKEVAYSRVDGENKGSDLKVNVTDELAAVVGDNQLDVTFCRKVFFTPDALYKAHVTLELIFTFKSNTQGDVAGIDWEKALVRGDNPFIGNIISRASFLLSAITSSYGQQPLITPPVFVSGNQQ